MIRWAKPAKLEEFLQPNEVNWSVPGWMEEKIQQNQVTRTFHKSAKKLVNNFRREKAVVYEARVRDIFGCSQFYEEILTGGNNETVVRENYDTIYHDLFLALFSPSPPIAKQVDEKMKAADLSPGEYAIAHYRAFYAIEHEKEQRSTSQLSVAAITAANCASVLRPGGPVYFASDSKIAVDAVRNYARTGNHSIVTFDSPEALHLDQTEDWESRPPSDFYSVFVDLYLMSNGRCVTYGQGGFGRYALLLGYNSTCASRHFYRSKRARCSWTELE
jgi:hypothetical protein